jgi:hypothetical protein
VDVRGKSDTKLTQKRVAKEAKMVPIRKPLPPDLVLSQARERLELLRSFVNAPEDRGPIDAQFGYAISTIIYDAITVVLNETNTTRHGRLSVDYAECLVNELSAPTLSRDTVAQLETLNTNNMLAVRLGIQIDREHSVELADRFLAWADEIISRTEN